MSGTGGLPGEPALLRLQRGWTGMPLHPAMPMGMMLLAGEQFLTMMPFPSPSSMYEILWNLVQTQ